MVDLFDGDDEEILDAALEEIEEDTPAAPAEIPPPRMNAVLFGYEDIEQKLLQEFNNNRLPHALILSGPFGIGKATLAFRLARFLLSQPADGGGGLFGPAEKPTSLQVKLDDPLFRRIASGGHADLMTIEREYDDKKDRLKNEISVDAVRKVHPFLRKTAAEGGWRIVIIDQAEYLNANGQNALLKILEEPPEKALLILTTSQPGSFLPTIRSRCRHIALQPLRETVLSKLMDIYCPQLSAEKKAGIARLSEGSIGRCLQLASGNGLAAYQNIRDLLSTAPQMDMLKIHDFAEKNGRYGAEKEYESVREMMLWILSRAARLTARAQEISDMMQGDASFYRHLLSAYTPAQLLSVYDGVAQIFFQTENSNLDKRQALLSAFILIQKPRDILPMTG
jgi:DNA polymerase-3 subunit delta'